MEFQIRKYLPLKFFIVDKLKKKKITQVFERAKNYLI